MKNEFIMIRDWPQQIEKHCPLVAGISYKKILKAKSQLSSKFQASYLSNIKGNIQSPINFLCHWEYKGLWNRTVIMPLYLKLQIYTFQWHFIREKQRQNKWNRFVTP